MMDKQKMLDGWNEMKSGSVMNKYTQQSPGEVSKLDTWFNDPTQPLPSLVSAFGDGFTKVLAGALSTVSPPPPPPSGIRWGQTKLINKTDPTYVMRELQEMKNSG